MTGSTAAIQEIVDSHWRTVDVAGDARIHLRDGESDGLQPHRAGIRL